MAEEPMESTRAVAGEIRRRLPGIGRDRLHKILYYIQGCHLAEVGVPAFGDAIEAWVKGPVVATLWHFEKGRSSDSCDPPDKSVNDVITRVLRMFSEHSARDLVWATQKETPWLDATNGGRRVARQVIPHESLMDYFSTRSDEFDAPRGSIAAACPDDRLAADPTELRDERTPPPSV